VAGVSCSAIGIVVDTGSTTTEPRRDGELPESLTTEKSEFGLEHDRHDQDEHESGKGHDEVDSEATDCGDEPEDQSGNEQQRPTSGDAIATLSKRGVLFELLLDLAKNSLFFLGERHRDIIARSWPFLNAAGTVVPTQSRS
jgi:hypothetical protein